MREVSASCFIAEICIVVSCLPDFCFVLDSCVDNSQLTRMLYLLVNKLSSQVVPIQQILQVDTLNGSRDATLTFVTQLKCLAFSVFSRCRKSLQLNINAKSLTGFGPAARHEALLRQREVSFSFHPVSYYNIVCLIGKRSNAEQRWVMLRAEIFFHCGLGSIPRPGVTCGWGLFVCGCFSSLFRWFSPGCTVFLLHEICVCCGITVQVKP